MAFLFTSGLLPGFLAILFCGITAALGLYFLSVSASAICSSSPSPSSPRPGRRKDDVPRRASWAALSAKTYPSAGVFFDAAIAIKCKLPQHSLTCETYLFFELGAFQTVKDRNKVVVSGVH